MSSKFLSLRNMVAFCAAIAIGSPIVAHENISIKDPSIKFEILINQGIIDSEKRSADATYFSEDIRAARSIYLKSALWKNKSVLNVCFWNGSDEERLAVAESAVKWNGKSRLSLSFFPQKTKKTRKCVRGDTSEIRISLVSSDDAISYENGQDRNGNWSLIGRQSLFVPSGRPEGTRYDVTMNLPFVGQYLKLGDLTELNFTVRHEFGHALGLLHEFQSDKCTGWIDVKQLAKDQDWYGAAASSNLDPLSSLTGRLRVDFGQIGSYDVNSIMQYNFPIKYYIERPPAQNPCKRSEDVTQPSPGDFITLASIYGSVQSSSNVYFFMSAAGTLLTRRGLVRKYEFASTQGGPTAAALSAVLESIDRVDKFERGIDTP